MKHDVSLTLPWMREGTKHFLAVAESLSDSDFRTDSRLPGWSKAHVVGHVARNAQALTRLATWARTGVETPMYADRSQRVVEIEASAVLSPSELRESLVDTAERLDSELGRLAPGAWKAQVRSALGRTIPAAEVPWMRIREVWLHATDLGNDTLFDAIPDGVVDLLLDDICANLSGKDGCPPVTVAPVDRTTTWRLGTGDPFTTAAGRAAELVGWVSGRWPRPDLPLLPGWL